jgi:hypothetical protein
MNYKLKEKDKDNILFRNCLYFAKIGKSAKKKKLRQDNYNCVLLFYYFLI